MTNHTAATLPTADPRLVGITGWLIVPAIGLAVGPIAGPLLLVSALGYYSDVAAAGYGGLYALELLVEFGLLVFLTYAATRFFRKKRNAPSTLVAFMITSVACSFALLLIYMAAGAEVFATETGKQLARTLVGAAIWIPDFRRAKRVQATFVN